ncbi:MAG: CAP domain-containing protein [Brevundimonas sp.]|jgi:hypothetical protein|nr:CAP domain-containing protein [Brevundimonas sp.]
MSRSFLLLLGALAICGALPCFLTPPSDAQISTSPIVETSALYRLKPVIEPAGVAVIVKLHNAERVRFDAVPLVWDNALAQDADAWAEELARTGALEHAPDEQRKGQGENLFMGTAGAFSIYEMINAFLDERSDFQPGVFPNVTRDKSWETVGHYTQAIWPTTKRIGCGMARGQEMDFLVCRYFPAGNIIGETVP